MKEKELRIGNILHLSDEWYKQNPLLYNTPKIITVDSIDYDSMIGTSMYFINGYDIRLLSTIPLTEEWLRNFGFEITYKSDFRLKYDHPCNYIGFDFSKTGDIEMEGFRFYGQYIKIKYVHELQNLYYTLTKEELVLAVSPISEGSGKK